MPTNSTAAGRTLVLILACLCLATACSCDDRPSQSEAAAVVPASPASLPRLDPNIVMSDAPAQDVDDPRLRYLREPSARWRRLQGPERMVVDQVCLVPDVPTFLAAIADWDERRFYPILIDDPQWTLSFIRAFRPARIVRCAAAAPTATGTTGDAADDRWRAALTAVSRGWVHETPEAPRLPPASAFPRLAEPTPPAAVLSHPGSPTLAAAVALAAGRFQPLLRLEPMTVEGGLRKGRIGPETLGFGDSPAEADAVAFARQVEARVAALTADYSNLGDDLDFLTLAGDWPFRYQADSGEGILRGEGAVDDLIGRILPAAGAYNVEKARLRWAYTGRILGDASSSVYRAMAALFLQPESALLWDTYDGGRLWDDYAMTAAATTFGVIRPETGAIVARSGDGADLASWHRLFRPARRFDLLMMNSSGAPREFAIRRGPGRPSDVPFVGPSIVSMIHSFSAAYPDDPSTIAGRFLDQGAFIYYGSMFEPYLSAFRTPRLLSQLIVAQVPLGAALRAGPYERFGLPWRLVYLGDPLYRVRPTSSLYGPVRMSPKAWREADAGRQSPTVSFLDLEWHKARPPRLDAGPAETVDWCLDAALSSLRGPSHEETSTAVEPTSLAPPDGLHLRGILARVDRSRLDPRRRTILDELMIDQSTAAGESQPLLQWMLHVPPRDRSPRLWRAIETATMSRLAELARADDFAAALDFWSDQVLRPWPPGSVFPAHLTQRFAAVAETPPTRRLEAYRSRLADLAGLASRRDPAGAAPQTSVLAEEFKRVEQAAPPPR